MKRKTAENTLSWHDASRLTLEGKGWCNTGSVYERLPEKARDAVNDRHWLLSRCPAGMTIHFSTNTPTLSVKWDGIKEPAGISGLDLYVRHGGRWRWLAVATATQTLNEKQLFADIPAEYRDYMLYLPLFYQVQKIEIGIPTAFEIKAAKPRTNQPVVFYGTSITQGSRASRAGMTYCAILGRRLDTPVINLGFSGNGNMDSQFVDLLCELDPAVYVLDCLPNMTAPLIAERVEPAVRKLRAAHPETPIVLVEMFYCDAFLKPDRRERYLASNRAQHAVYERLVHQGIGKLECVRGDDLIGTDGEATIDGTHFTDLGFMRFSEGLVKPLSRIIG